MPESRVITISTRRKPWSTIGKANATQLLEQAVELFEMSHARAAAILARSAIETTLCQMAKLQNGVPVFGIRSAIETLEARGVLDSELRKRILLSINTGNRAAHGQNFGELSDVLFAVETARHLVPILAEAKGKAKTKLLQLLHDMSHERAAVESAKIWPSGDSGDAAKAA